MWGDYLDHHLEYAFAGEPRIGPMGSTPVQAEQNLKLVLKGTKRSVTHSLLGIQYRRETLPKIGDFTILTDWEGEARCIVRTVAVHLKPFFSISPAYAKMEGEGNGTLEAWKKSHWDLFAEELKAYGRTPHESMIVVCEVFDKVYDGA